MLITELLQLAHHIMKVEHDRLGAASSRIRLQLTIDGGGKGCDNHLARVQYGEKNAARQMHKSQPAMQSR